MAVYTTYGAWAPSSSAAKRIRIRYEWDVPSVPASATSVTATLRVYCEANRGFWWNGGALSWSGGYGSGSATYNANIPTGGSQLVRTLTQSFPLTPSPQTITVATSISGLGYVGATATHSASVTLPATGSTRPAAPPSMSANRAGDAGDRFTVFWPAVAHAARYRVGVIRESDGHNAVLFETAQTVFVDQRPLDDRYRYWVLAIGHTGDESAITYSPTVATRPAPPEITWSRSGTTVNIQVTNRARFPRGARLWWREAISSATWQVLTETTEGGDLEYQHVPPAGKTVQYRADTRVSEPLPVTWSLYALSTLVPGITPPGAPALVSPVGVAAAGPMRFEWAHTALDGSPQSAAELRYRPTSSTAWTAVTKTTETSHTVSLGMGMYEWQVRTRGAHPDWSPWSSVAGFRVAARPTVSITAPPSTLTSSRCRPVLAWSDASGAAMVWWAATLTRDGQQLARVTGSGQYTPRDIGPLLTDATTYTLTIEARSATGLTAPTVARTFTTKFLPPAKPTLAGVFVDDQGVVELTVTPGTGGPAGTPATQHVHVEVSYDDGRTWAALATITPTSGATVVTDPLPPLGASPAYRAVAVSGLPSEAASDVLRVGTDTCRVWVTAADGSHRAAWCADGLELRTTHDAGTVLEHYDGDPYPTAHYSAARPTSITLAADLYPDADTQGRPEAWQALIGRPLWLRTPNGHRIHGVIEGALRLTDEASVGVLRTRIEARVTATMEGGQ